MKRPCSTISLVALSTTLAGCYQGNNSEGGFGEIDTGIDEGNTVTPRDNVKVVPDGEAEIVASLSQEGLVRVTNSDWWSDIQAGDVLVFAESTHTPDGLLRRVITATFSPDGLEISTEQAYLTDVFSDGHITLSVPLTATAPREVIYSAEGVSVIPQGATPSTGDMNGARALELEAIKHVFKDTPIHDIDGDLTTKDDQVTVTGELQAAVGTDIDLNLGLFKVDYFKAEFKAEASAKLLASVKPALNHSGEKVLWDAYLTPFVVPVLGIPITVTPQVQLVAKFEISTDFVNADAGMTTSMTLTGRVERIDGDWMASSTKMKSFEFITPKVSESPSAQIKVAIGPRIKTKILGLAGPTIDAFGHLRLKVATNPLWELFVGLTASMGVEFSVANKDWLTLKAGPYELVKLEESIAKSDPNGPNPDPDPGPACGDGALDVGEDCDGAVGPNSCGGEGFDGGELTCTSCKFDTTKCCNSECVAGQTKCAGGVANTCHAEMNGCDAWGPGIPCTFGCDGNACKSQTCGDGNADADEICDKADLNDASCVSLNFDAGQLACNANCTYDTASCCNVEYSINNAEYPTYTSAVDGCAEGGGVVLVISAQHISDSTIRFYIKKSDGTAWGAAADLYLFVGVGPTCGNPNNMPKGGTFAVEIGQTVQTIDLPVDPYEGGWASGTTKEFWVGKSEAGFKAGRASGTIEITRNSCM